MPTYSQTLTTAWNRLPSFVVNSQSVALFRRSLNIRMLVFAWFKSDPQKPYPFDSRMPQNSPMTIYDAQQIVSPAVGFRTVDLTSLLFYVY